MGASVENPLEAAERRARESARASEGVDRERKASEAAMAKGAAERSSALIKEWLDRMAQANWPAGEEISVLEHSSETVGLLRKRTRPRTISANRKVWTAPVGVGHRTGLPIGAMLEGGWEKIFHDSQLAVDRDGTLWHGAASEKVYRDWRRLDPPSNETKVEALAEVLGAILAKYT